MITRIRIASATAVAGNESTNCAAHETSRAIKPCAAHHGPCRKESHHTGSRAKASVSGKDHADHSGNARSDPAAGEVCKAASSGKACAKSMARAVIATNENLSRQLCVTGAMISAGDAPLRALNS
jgi:hypothetical protein